MRIMLCPVQCGVSPRSTPSRQVAKQNKPQTLGAIKRQVAVVCLATQTCKVPWSTTNVALPGCRKIVRRGAQACSTPALSLLRMEHDMNRVDHRWFLASRLRQRRSIIRYYAIVVCPEQIILYASPKSIDQHFHSAIGLL